MYGNIKCIILFGDDDNLFTSLNKSEFSIDWYRYHEKNYSVCKYGHTWVDHFNLIRCRGISYEKVASISEDKEKGASLSKHVENVSHIVSDRLLGHPLQSEGLIKQLSVLARGINVTETTMVELGSEINGKKYNEGFVKNMLNELLIEQLTTSLFELKKLKKRVE